MKTLEVLIIVCQNHTLRAAAILSFSKFLCVSSSFCDQHHRLLFKILETSKDANIRSNVVIALGDVAVSFSTIIDENSNELYKGLTDKDFVVKNTLMVLNHLILNGMIKVKGQLGEMAKCVDDPLFRSFWSTGVMKGRSPHTPASHVNPTFAYLLGGQEFNVDSATHAVAAFHLAPVLAQNQRSAHPISAEDLVDAATTQFSNWCKSFHLRVNAIPSITIRFFARDFLILQSIAQVPYNKGHEYWDLRSSLGFVADRFHYRPFRSRIVSRTYDIQHHRYFQLGRLSWVVEHFTCYRSSSTTKAMVCSSYQYGSWL